MSKTATVFVLLVWLSISAWFAYQTYIIMVHHLTERGML